MALYASIPSLLFLILLSLDHSLKGFIDTFFYNLHYSSNQEENSAREKFNDYYKNLIQPVFGLAVMLLYLLYKNLADKRSRTESLVFTIIFMSSTLFVFLAPYNLGHYYFSSFVLLFVLLAKQYAIFKANHYPLTLPFLILLFYYIYRIDESANPEFTFKIRPFQPDKITQRLLSEKDASLFVDYVSVGSYYTKARKVHPAYLPVALPVHFDESENGKKNRERIWRELSGNPPDYLITTFTVSYFSWHFPQPDFYFKNYHKIDSIYPANENVIYLWKLNKP